MRASDPVNRQAAFALGGNATTLAFVSDLSTGESTIDVRLVPVARTPLGTVLGDTHQNVGVPRGGVGDWVDVTFPPDDESAFVARPRELELLIKTGWRAEFPETLDERSVINADDLPDDVYGALLEPAQPLTQCAACRRLCVRDQFVYRERQLCAADYHRQVFGKRGPWRSEPVEDRHFDSLPSAAYVAPELLLEAGAVVVLACADLEESVAREAVNLVLRTSTGAHMAVRMPDGYTVLRET